MPLSPDALKQQLAARAQAGASGMASSMGGAAPPGGPRGIFDVGNDGTTWYPAVRIKASTGTAFVVTNGEAVLTGQNAGMTEYADHAEFRASPPPADGAVFRIVSPCSEYRYSTSSGAGWADEDDTILKPDSVALGSNGRAFSTRASEHAATFAAARAMKGLLGRAKHVHIKSGSSVLDGAGGIFDVETVSVNPDNDCTVLEVDIGVYLVRRDADGATVSATWAYPDRTGAVDCTAKLQALVDSVDEGTEIQFPRGTYLVQGLVVDKALKFTGRGATIKTNHLTELGAFEVSSGECIFDGLTFDGDRWNQTGSHSDNILYHRRRSAINSSDVSCDDVTIRNCKFTNFYQGAVLVIGDRFIVDKCRFSDINTEALIAGYHSTDATVLCDGVSITNCLFERIGVKTSAVDAREYGNDLPNVTGDAIIVHGRNVRVSSNSFLEVDRCAAKFERPRDNFLVEGNIIRNSYPGNSNYHAFGFQQASGDSFVPSSATPSNISLINNTCSRPSGFLGTGLVALWGITIANNRIVVPAGGGANGVILLDECRDVHVSGNNIKCSVVNGVSIKTANTSAVSPYSGLYITDNDIDSIATAVLLSVSQSDVQIKNNRFNTGTALGVWGFGVLDSVSMTDNRMYDMRFTDGAAADKTNFVIARNELGKYLESSFGTVYCRDNVFRTINTYGRAILGVFGIGSDSHYSTDASGEMAFFTAGDTTPSVKGRELFFSKQTAPTSITGFDDPAVGKRITIIFADGNTTLVAGATMKLAGGVNFVGTANDSITLRYIFDTSVGELGWVEIARSVN